MGNINNLLDITLMKWMYRTVVELFLFSVYENTRTVNHIITHCYRIIIFNL